MSRAVVLAAELRREIEQLARDVQQLLVEGGPHGDELVCTSDTCGLAYPVRDVVSGCAKSQVVGSGQVSEDKHCPT